MGGGRETQLELLAAMQQQRSRLDDASLLSLTPGSLAAQESLLQSLRLGAGGLE
jgi:hypothetical protein